jgi:hypothetical protein
MSIFSGNCYDYPQYYDLAFGADTRLEAHFIEGAGIIEEENRSC